MTTTAAPYCIDEPVKQYVRILGEFSDERHARLFASILREFVGEDVAVTAGIYHTFAVRSTEP